MESLISFARKYLRINNEASLWKLGIILKHLIDKTFKMNKQEKKSKMASYYLFSRIQVS